MLVLDDSLVRPFPTANEYTNEALNTIEDLNNAVAENTIKEGHSDLNSGKDEIAISYNKTKKSPKEFINKSIKNVKNVHENTIKNKDTIQNEEKNKRRRIWISMGKIILTLLVLSYSITHFVCPSVAVKL